MCRAARVRPLRAPQQTTHQFAHVRTDVHYLRRLTTSVYCIQVTYPHAINLCCVDRDLSLGGAHALVCGVV